MTENKQKTRKRRLHNVLCLVYGSNPAKLKSLVREGGLHPQRAASCEKEFKRVSGAWFRLLSPFARKPRDIASRRCNDVFLRLLRLMTKAKAPAKVVTEYNGLRTRIVGKCIQHHVAHPAAMAKWVYCVRFANVYGEAKKCLHPVMK